MLDQGLDATGFFDISATSKKKKRERRKEKGEQGCVLLLHHLSEKQLANEMSEVMRK